MRIVWFFPSYITASTGYSYTIGDVKGWIVTCEPTLLSVGIEIRFQVSMTDHLQPGKGLWAAKTNFALLDQESILNSKLT